MFLFKKVPTISMEQLENKMTQPIELIDVRSQIEYEGGHIAKAKNVPLDRIKSYKGKIDKPVYIICQSGARSKQATDYLIKAGYDAFNVQGGMNQWKKSVKVGK